MKAGRLATWSGIAGPLIFTAAWVVGSLRQAGLSPGAVQLSGLAADDATDPQIMIAGFTALGACSVAFGAALRREAALRPEVALRREVGRETTGPWLVMVGGVAAIAAGVFRRDHMLLVGPGFPGESWHNQVHDVASFVAYAAMLAAPFVLARRFRARRQWAVIARPVQVLVLASAAALALFASGAAEPGSGPGNDPWMGSVQRAAVTLALAAEALIAARMLTLKEEPPEPGATR